MGLSFLTDRVMQVCIGDEYSDWVRVSSGVPQGSVLGPLLFLIYINELPEKVKSNIQMFADDTKVYKQIKAPRDQLEFQDDLEKLGEWSEEWLLAFNVGKCKRMRMGHGNPRYQHYMRTPDGQVTLDEINEEKDLGV